MLFRFIKPFFFNNFTPIFKLLYIFVLYVQFLKVNLSFSNINDLITKFGKFEKQYDLFINLFIKSKRKLKQISKYSVKNFFNQTNNIYFNLIFSIIKIVTIVLIK